MGSFTSEGGAAKVLVAVRVSGSATRAETGRLRGARDAESVAIGFARVGRHVDTSMGYISLHLSLSSTPSPLWLLPLVC